MNHLTLPVEVKGSLLKYRASQPRKLNKGPFWQTAHGDGRGVTKEQESGGPELRWGNERWVMRLC